MKTKILKKCMTLMAAAFIVMFITACPPEPSDTCYCDAPCLIPDCECPDCPGNILPGCDCDVPCLIPDCECPDCPGNILPGCDCDVSCTGDCDCNDCPCEPENPPTIPAAPGNIVVNRTGSNATEFKYSVGAVDGADGYRTKFGGAEVGGFTGINGTVNSNVNNAGVTELQSFAFNTAGESTDHATVPGMVKYSQDNAGLAQGYNDWFKFLRQTLLAANLAGIPYAEMGFASNVDRVNFYNAINTILSGGITAGDVAEVKFFHEETARTATENLLKAANWPIIEEMLTTAPEDIRNEVNETLPRVWFNANELMGPGAARNNLDGVMKQRLEAEGYNKLAPGAGWVE